MPTKATITKATRAVNQLLKLQVLTTKEEVGSYIRRIPPEMFAAIEDFSPKEPKCGHWNENSCDWCGQPRQYWVTHPAAWCWFVPVGEWSADICMDCFSSLPGAGDWLDWIKENLPDMLILPSESNRAEMIAALEGVQ
jgi:hypothetical protein